MCRERERKRAHDLEMLKDMEEANKRNYARKFYTIVRRMKDGFHR
jgi:hypothetical protein